MIMTSPKTKHKFPYKWNIKDGYPAKGIEYHGSKVFSCFACGGGSSMGYKLAGYEVVGCNEIDPRMMACYIKNHYPKYTYLEPIQEFKLRKDLPSELYNLDILDGSPPCSSFSMAGNRDKDWGKEKKFREGQAKQVLDTLFFDFIDVAKELQPKVVVAENVKGLLLGDAKQYVIEIYKAFDDAGYIVQHFLLNAATMGVPQERERVFFVALRKDLATPFLRQVDMFTQLPLLEIDYKEPEIAFGEFFELGVDDRPAGRGKMYDYWLKRQNGDKCFSEITIREVGRDIYFNNKILNTYSVSQTLTSNSDCLYLYNEYRKPNKNEVCCISTYPQDYDFLDSPYYYLAGMSVPPVMMAQIANDIYNQWLSKI